MLTLQTILHAVDHLTPEERAELRAYLDRRDAQPLPVRALSPEERIRCLGQAAQAIREGFTDAEWAEVESAMNEEYIEPVDDDLWQD